MPVFQSRTYTVAILKGTDGYAYAGPPASGSEVTMFDQMLADVLAELSAATTAGGVAPGAAGAVLVSNGSSWVRSASPTLTGRIITAGYSTDATKTAALLHIYANVAATTVLAKIENADRRLDIYGDEIRSISSDLTFNGNGANGICVGSPTGGGKGGGTGNFAGDIYKNNTAYTNPDYAFEHWATGKIRKFAKNPGASRYKGRKSLKQLEAYVRKHYRFPQISGKPSPIFDRSEIMLELMEEAYMHFFDLNRRLEALEG